MTTEKYDITEEDLAKSEYTTMKNIKKKVVATFKEATESSRDNKSKINYLLEGTEIWTPRQPKPYMLHLGKTRQEPYLRHEPECYL